MFASCKLFFYAPSPGCGLFVPILLHYIFRDTCRRSTEAACETRILQPSHWEIRRRWFCVSAWTVRIVFSNHRNIPSPLQVPCISCSFCLSVVSDNGSLESLQRVILPQFPPLRTLFLHNNANVYRIHFVRTKRRAQGPVNSPNAMEQHGWVF